MANSGRWLCITTGFGEELMSLGSLPARAILGDGRVLMT